MNKSKLPFNIDTIFQRIHWTGLIFIGAILNVFVNYGYKVTTGKTDIAWIATGALSVTAFIMLLYGTVAKGKPSREFLKGYTPSIVIAVGAAVAVVFVCFLTALATGPISLVDPLWACIYSLVSLAIGMLIIRERPNGIALTGIALYLLGAILMAQG